MALWDGDMRDCLGDAGLRIEEALGTANPADRVECLEAWLRYLDARLALPFEARMETDRHEAGPQPPRQVQVKAVRLIDADFGVIAEVQDGSEGVMFPLADLVVTDRDSANHRTVSDYIAWLECVS